MPTYEYRCLECGSEFEHFQKMTDDPLTTCPDCGGEVQRLISRGGGVLFKGAGFYATDYRSGGGETGPSKGSDSSESTAAGDGAGDSDD